MLVVLLSFISPLCGVALTPDCGIITILAFSSRGVIQTLVWHQYYYSCSFLPRSHSDPRLAPSIYFFGISGGLPPDISVIFPSIIIFAHDAFMHTFVISFVRTVLRVLSQYSLGLLIWPDVDEGDFLDEEFDSASDA